MFNDNEIAYVIAICAITIEQKRLHTDGWLQATIRVVCQIALLRRSFLMQNETWERSRADCNGLGKRNFVLENGYESLTRPIIALKLSSATSTTDTTTHQPDQHQQRPRQQLPRQPPQFHPPKQQLLFLTNKSSVSYGY